MSGVESKNTSAMRALMVNAITMEPMARNGLRVASRINMFTPFCTWFTSFVMRVTRPPAPSSSISRPEKRSTWPNTCLRRPEPKPKAATLAKYWQVQPASPPSTASKSSSAPPFST